MTEQEYIDTMDLRSVAVATSALSVLFPTENIDEEELKMVRRILSKWLDALYEAVRIEGFPKDAAGK